MSEQSSSTVSHLVIVGSSSGGIEALSKLVSALPEDFAAPIVIAQHLSPDHESRLREILAHRSTLPVRTVIDHDVLEPGVVYVVPSDRHVNITSNEVDLRVDPAGRPKPSIDLLLSSAAGVYGERLIAVILSGTGTDGAEGARAVHWLGGTVIVQDPETAEYGEMPGAIAPNVADVVESIDKIGATLGRLLSGELEVREAVEQDGWQGEALARFLEDLRDRHGMDFRSYKEPTIMRRLKRRMAVTGHETLEEYARYLEEDPEEYRQLVSAFLIKVTEFFRDLELFEYLGEEVLPRLIEEARGSGRQLRIWSAGCATGEEAYSLAILLSEILGSEAGLFNVKIFATDADADAVNFARQGLYPPSALSPLTDEQIERFFDREGGQYQVKKAIRGMIVFGEHDLARRSPFPRIDLVVSRNVLIYFASELQRRALQLFAHSLRDGGYLVLGKAESVSPLPEFFESTHSQHKVYRRRGARFLMPLTSSYEPAPRPVLRQGRAARAQDVPVPPQAAADPQRSPRERARATTDEDLLNQLPVGVVVLDRRYDIRAINNAARRLLAIHGVAVGEDFLHLLRNVPYAEVRGAIDAAFRNGEHTVAGEFGVEDVTTGVPSYLQMTCYPRRPEGGITETVTIVVSDVTAVAGARQKVEEELESVGAEFERFRREAEAEAARLRLQNERLIETNRQLEDANRELNDLAEELQVANEEALLNTEDAQAATEEVETLNEELQATNEELETLNEELQATVEELNTTNDDLQARRNELQEIVRSREEERRAADEERRRLEAILLSISDPVLAVDSDGRVLFCNDAFTGVFGDGSVGAHAGLDSSGDLPLLDEDGNPLSPGASPRARAARGEAFEMRFSVQDGGVTRRYEVKGSPIDGISGGGVIVLREVPAGGG